MYENECYDYIFKFKDNLAKSKAAQLYASEHDML